VPDLVSDLGVHADWESISGFAAAVQKSEVDFSQFVVSIYLVPTKAEKY